MLELVELVESLVLSLPVFDASFLFVVAVAFNRSLQNTSPLLTPLSVRQLSRSRSDWSLARQYRPQSPEYDFTDAGLQHLSMAAELSEELGNPQAASFVGRTKVLGPQVDVAAAAVVVVIFFVESGQTEVYSLETRVGR